MAGDYAGVSPGTPARFGRGSEFRGLQRGKSGGTGHGRLDCGGGRMRHNILAECVFVPGRDPVSVSLEAADRSSTQDSARMVRDWRRLLLCARERTGAVGAAAN